jgi:hypothetical protein
MKEANPIVSLYVIMSFDEQKQELKQLLNEEKRFRSWVHCQPTTSSQDSNFTKTP